MPIGFFLLSIWARPDLKMNSRMGVGEQYDDGQSE